MKIGIDDSGIIQRWVETCLDCPSLGPAVSFFVEKNDQLLAGITLYNYTKNDIHIAVYATTPRFLTRTLMANVFGYCFDQLQVDRITTTVQVSNSHANRFNQRIGFVKEGRVRRAISGEDAVLYGMLREDCRWLKGVSNG
ncbi:hypothetical protein GCM10023116_48320 [Kistimonas scapharcae]|uniref:N-acetyltransferase domain-containing protein n=1 Tax=Kistimonas scapharcae TaxID=1036133 RepID=A0ABP8V8G0_9GAMM